MDILIIDDHPLMLGATSEMLGSLLGEARITKVLSFQETVEILQSKHFKVILSDLSIPDATPDELIDHLERQGPTTKLAFLSAMDRTDPVVQRIIASGHIFLSKSQGFKEVANVLQSLLLVKDAIDMVPANEFRSLVQVPGNKPLTLKQVAIMDGIVDGLTAKEIARKLDISPDTVRAHVKEAYLRLGANARSEAISIFVQAKKLSEKLHQS